MDTLDYLNKLIVAQSLNTSYELAHYIDDNKDRLELSYKNKNTVFKRISKSFKNAELVYIVDTSFLVPVQEIFIKNNTGEISNVFIKEDGTIDVSETIAMVKKLYKELDNSLLNENVDVNDLESFLHSFNFEFNR